MPSNTNIPPFRCLMRSEFAGSYFYKTTADWEGSNG